MTRPAVFYAWQADRPRRTTRDLIRACAENAVSTIAVTGALVDAPRLDHDTLEKSGTPPIAATIFQKIRSSAVFIADVTLTTELRDAEGRVLKRACNPNVMIELGYAAATIGWDRIILVMNKHKGYGGPSDLPFDLRNHRFPITFELGPESTKDVSRQLTDELSLAIRACLSAEYDLVDSTLRKMSSFARATMKKYGPDRMFWETTGDNKVLSRFDHAVSQMLAAGLIECVDAATDTGVGYNWTYLGQQCCLRLGAWILASDVPDVPQVQNVVFDDSMYDELMASTDTQPSDHNEP